ncbi:MAG TPA: 3-hydroxyacyl-CoA dehydrogenase family protein [Tepidisphaeraceae bacterium]|jgi:3-hydroxybutyryl-CoA dehydrogenase|nr:3-hydroxyacyl-CoA dehydrogenase family protein [Tepidisphaeraceae bacterium]
MNQQTVGVAGLGLLGRGIVACLLSHGFRVIGYARSQQTRDEARTYVASAINDLIQRGGFPKTLAAEWSTRYIQAKSIHEFASCDFVIESIFEDLDAKRDLFDQLEAVVGPVIPIASNTSALPISTLQKGRKHPERFIGTHWAEPCHLTRFLEVIRGDATNDATADAAMSLARRAGKDPSLVRKDVEGFIVNRIGYAMFREAFWLLENGVADVETIDRSFSNAISVWANIAGPFRWMDLTGIPAYAAVMERLWPKLSCTTKVPDLMRSLVDSGAKGISNGRGFYSYTPEESARWEERLIENVWKNRPAIAAQEPK